MFNVQCSKFNVLILFAYILHLTTLSSVYIISMIISNKYFLIRGHLCAKCPLIIPQSAPQTAASFTCYESILPRCASDGILSIIRSTHPNTPDVPVRRLSGVRKNNMMPVLSSYQGEGNNLIRGVIIVEKRLRVRPAMTLARKSS